MRQAIAVVPRADRRLTALPLPIDARGQPEIAKKAAIFTLVNGGVSR